MIRVISNSNVEVLIQFAAVFSPTQKLYILYRFINVFNPLLIAWSVPVINVVFEALDITIDKHIPNNPQKVNTQKP